MVSLDLSVIWAIIIFLGLIVALHQILFKPLQKILAERESRTSGLMNEAQAKTSHQMGLLSDYQATIKHARMEAYRQQEQIRNEALKKRAEVMAKARTAGEQMIQDSRASLLAQVQTAKRQLDLDAKELAHGIASAILGRSAMDVHST